MTIKLQELTEQETDMVSGGGVVGDLGTVLDKSILALNAEFGRIETSLAGIAQALAGAGPG
jgi:hypothetical protein